MGVWFLLSDIVFSINLVIIVFLVINLYYLLSIYKFYCVICEERLIKVNLFVIMGFKG